jgi:hypothetical protein
MLLPRREVSQYRAWMRRRLAARARLYPDPVEPGLISLATAVWDGSPAHFLKTLARSIIDQNRDGACRWLLLDNGCSNRTLLAYLEELRGLNWIEVHRADRNMGIARGLRYCLERAAGRYFAVVDADDYLYPDALRIASAWIRAAGYPTALYSDEDKIIGRRIYQPYFKPDWDPVLLANSAYVAHLGIVDRERALALGAYTDPTTEGSADWDLFIRLMLAGDHAVHIPEVLYSWRVHARSTADDAAIKPYVRASQRAVLQRLLDSRGLSRSFEIECSPLLGGTPHWHLLKKEAGSRPVFEFRIRAGARRQARDLLPLARDAANRNALVLLIGEDVEIENPAWKWEAAGIFEIHPDVVMAGARIRNRKGMVTEAGCIFGFGGGCGCPDRGRDAGDPGYFTQMSKLHSVSAVSTQFAIIDAAFLAALAAQTPAVTLEFLGPWAGAFAARAGKRIVYSPFLSGISDLDWSRFIDPGEQQRFLDHNRDLIPDRRFYSRALSLDKAFAFADAAESATGAAPAATHCSL